MACPRLWFCPPARRSPELGACLTQLALPCLCRRRRGRRGLLSSLPREGSRGTLPNAPSILTASAKKLWTKSEASFLSCYRRTSLTLTREEDIVLERMKNSLSNRFPTQTRIFLEPCEQDRCAGDGVGFWTGLRGGSREESDRRSLDRWLRHKYLSFQTLFPTSAAPQLVPSRH